MKMIEETLKKGTRVKLEGDHLALAKSNCMFQGVRLDDFSTQVKERREKKKILKIFGN